MPKKSKNETCCLWRLFGYTLLACIIALIYDLGKTYLSSGQKLAVKIVCAAVCVLVLLRIFGFIRRKYTLKQLDGMEWHRFEYACADILKMNGFKNVKVTQGSGDYGVDIIAYKNGKKYAVQCKRYSHKLDNKPIQEVKAGLAYYNCDIGAVMTNQYFTEPAKELARINGVKLWDRNALSKMLRKTAKDKPKNVKEKKTRKEKRPSFPPMTISDPLTREAIGIIATNQNANTDFIQRKLRLGYPHAESILSEIESLGMIGPQTETGREIRITAEDLPQLDIKNKA